MCVATTHVNESSLVRRCLKWLQLCFCRSHGAVAVFIVLELGVRQEVTPLTPRKAPAVRRPTTRKQPQGERQMVRERERESSGWNKEACTGATSVPAVYCISSTSRCLFRTPTERLRENTETVDAAQDAASRPHPQR